MVLGVIASMGLSVFYGSRVKSETVIARIPGSNYRAWGGAGNLPKYAEAGRATATSGGAETLYRRSVSSMVQASIRMGRATHELARSLGDVLCEC